ncbi:MAG: tetratricopeptide repeat protein [bacterium]|nr:tetratricopeptide repeat protein [Planctomycetota bacterium]HIL52740.1 tetratricopeptide repeat protein [Planctomycetota bacterium]
MSDPSSLKVREASTWWALIVIFPGIVFWNSLHGEFHLDDIYRIANNTGLNAWWPPWRHFLDPSTSATLPGLVQFRPFLPLCLSTNGALGNLLGIERLMSLHLGNLAIHILGVGLLYLLLRELLEHWGRQTRTPREAARIAVVGALLFGVHPVAGVSVNYLCGRDVLLMLAFLLAAFLSYVRLRRLGGTPWRWIVCALLLTGAQLSKANALAAPLLILCFEFTLGGQNFLSKKAWLRALPALVVLLSIQAYTILVLDFSDASKLLVDRGGVFEYPLTQFRMHLVWYGRNLVWPFYMRAEPLVEASRSLFEAGVLAGIALVAGSLTWLWRQRHRRPLMAFSLGAYWVLFSVTSSVLPMRRLVTDYRQVPSLAFGVLFFVLAGNALLRGRWRVALAVVALAWFGGTSVYMNRHWRTEESFWLHSVELGAGSQAHLNYGFSICRRDPALAEEHYLHALEMEPGNVWVMINLGILRIRTGDPEDGLALVRRAVSRVPTWAVAHYWFSIALSRTKLWEESAVEARVAVELDGRNQRYKDQRIKAQYALAFAHYRAEEYTLALDAVRILHEFKPSYSDSKFLEAFLLGWLDQPQAAVAAYEEFLGERPDHAQAHYNLGLIFVGQAEVQRAILEFQRVLEIDPAFRLAHMRLATCYADAGDDEASALHAELYRAE